MKRACVVLVGALVVVGCGKTLREELPTSAGNVPGPTDLPPQQVVVNPVPIPSPDAAPPPAAPPPSNPAPAPPPSNPAPAPTPRPATPPPSSGGGGGGTGTVQVTAGVHSYLRNGQLIPRSGTSFQVGDVLYLNCTPRDGSGQPVNNHGPIQGWWVDGTARFSVTDTHTFNPDCHTMGPGYIDIACQVDGVRSPFKRLTIE